MVQNTSHEIINHMQNKSSSSSKLPHIPADALSSWSCWSFKERLHELCTFSRAESAVGAVPHVQACLVFGRVRMQLWNCTRPLCLASPASFITAWPTHPRCRAALLCVCLVWVSAAGGSTSCMFSSEWSTVLPHRGDGPASCRLCVSEKWALAVGGNSWLDVVVLNCSSCCSVEFRCTPVRVSFSYWAGNSSPLSSNLFYYNRWLLIVPPIMKSWLNTLC